MNPAQMVKAITYPNPFLEQPCEEVSLPLGEYDSQVIEQMKNMMFGVDGKRTQLVAVGMAAPQIGVGRQMFIYCPASPSVKIAEKVRRHIIEVFNPEIISHGREEVVLHEGCVSDPGFYAPVKRWKIIEVVYYDRTGDRYYRKLTGWEARVFQHEVDHLRGVLCRVRHSEQAASSQSACPSDTA